MKSILIIIIIISLFSCSTKPDSETQKYFIIKHLVKTTPNTIESPPIPPLMFYGQHNFILLDSKIFYHDNNIIRRCGTGLDNSKPPRLYLTKDSLTEIPFADLATFLNRNMPDSITNLFDITASISSPSDTIKNPAFFIIKEYFKSKNIQCYVIRNWTEEENYALTAILKNKPYDPNTVDFKVGFDIMFIPPKR